MITPCAELERLADGTHLRVAGLVITRQRPGTASGVIFVTLEDETGVANVVVWPKVFERFRRAVMGGRLLRVGGKLQREGDPPYAVTHLIAWRIEDMSHLLHQLGDGVSEEGAMRRAPPPRARHPREQAKTLFPSRDFH